MSQGMAVTFGQRFGKPTVSDCLNSDIAFQTKETGAERISIQLNNQTNI